MANKSIDESIALSDGATPQEADDATYEPVYRAYQDTKIPVSKATGTFWSQRQKEGINIMGRHSAKDRWDEVIRYYQNDQSAKDNKRASIRRVGSGRDTEHKHSTENIVFANVSALLPSTYAKNPEVEITLSGKPQSGDEMAEKQAVMYERLVDKLMATKLAPGVNLKPKMRRATLISMLTNISFLVLNYTRKEDSNEGVFTEIEKLSEELTKAQTTNDLRDIEGKLAALEEKVSFLSPSGPSVIVRMPHEVIIDSACEDMSDFSRATYIMYADYIKTNTLQACYGKKNDKGEWISIYEPSHVLVGGKGSTDIQGHDDDINNFSLLGEDSDYAKYGYNNEEDFKDASRTKVWYVWDKTTRRVLLFADNKWDWPIWVWDDPLHLTRFFPIFPLSFYADPVDRFGRSEVMYYLDQQDELNNIADERARMRYWVSTKVFYDTNSGIDRTKLEAFLQGDSPDAIMGLNLPEGKKISDIIGTMAPPSVQFEGLYDNKQVLEAINRLSSVTPVLQNEQFKTNTTNKAIESYESSTQTRLDEKIDAIEDILGDIGLALIECAIQFMDAATVISLIGGATVQEAGGWKNMTPKEFHEQFSFSIVGGSTLKPTSKVKKEQAINLGQVLGQFVQASPAVILVLLRVLQRAFNDDFVITDDDWTMITQGMMQAIGAQAQAAQPSGGEGEGGGNEDEVINAAMTQVEELLSSLPDEQRVAVAQAIAEGVPLKQIIQELAQSGEQQAQAAPAQ